MNISVRANAKINLSLEVKDRDEDGYHTIETEMALLELESILHTEIEELEGAFQTTVKVIEGGQPIECPPIEKIVDLWSKERSVPLNVTVTIENPMRVMAGLGTASSYAAATLRTLEVSYLETHKNDGSNAAPLSVYKLFEISEHVGMDVPFFTSMLRRAKAEGRGEILTPKRPVRMPVILHYPEYTCSTKEEYATLDREGVKSFIDIRRNSTYLQYLTSQTGTDRWKLSGSGSTFFLLRPTVAEKNAIKKLQENSKLQFEFTHTKN